MYLNHPIQLFRHGMPAQTMYMGIEANTVCAGEGELASAQSNLGFVTRLAVPNSYSALFAWLSKHSARA